jgi:ArsR family metal-binding transcriptional regulator
MSGYCKDCGNQHCVCDAMIADKKESRIEKLKQWIEENKYCHGAFKLDAISASDLLEYLDENFKE